MLLRTAFEIILVGVTLWALFHEDRFAALERKILYALRRRNLRVVRGGSNYVRVAK